MLQGAEALAHAHQRGVIHRDIKPSNLILDPEGTVWLTDFGLAKRADEVTLTAAGILMGTPRYMSPEQAASAKQPIDHRTDIYSLGATLYELATGKPVFDSQTPQGVITQILNADPVPPRVLQGTLPRDLETIILKCLAKDASQRYQTAPELADDLRSFLDGRPIRARRASLVERAARWSKKHRRSTAVASATAALSLLLIVGATAGWSAYRESLNGRLSLTTEGPSLVAEVLNDRDELVIPSFPVPNPQPVVLPEGKHRMRLSGSGLLSETWTIDLERGQQQAYPVKLLDRFLTPPFEVLSRDPPAILELDWQAHLLMGGERGWRVVNDTTWYPLWPGDLKLPDAPITPTDPKTLVIWEEWRTLLQGYSDLGPTRWPSTGQSPGVMGGPDLNGDGRQDLIFASRVSPSLLAVSTSEGKPLWWFRAAPQFPEAHDLDVDPFDHQSSGEDAGVVGQPVLMELNDEPVVVAMFYSVKANLRTKAGKQFATQNLCWLEAVSARTGMSLWRAPLVVPGLAQYHQDSLKQFPHRPEFVAIDGRAAVVLTVHTTMFGFDLQSGRELWPAYQISSPPVQPTQFADLNGDHQPDALFVTRKDPNAEELDLRAVSLNSRETLWERAFFCPTLLQYNEVRTVGHEVTTVADLDGDGTSEIVIPVKDDWQQNAPHWCGVELLDGATGQARWQSKLFSLGRFSGSGMRALVQMLPGTDFDGDGHRDLFLASCGESIRITGSADNIQIDAISGKDGRRFWSQRQTIGDPFSGFQRSGRLQWGQVGLDCWPQLVVPVAKGVGGQPVTFILSPGTGRIEHVLSEVADPQVIDLNNDRVPELTYITGEIGGRRMTVLRGAPPVEWRRPGNWLAARDYDGDGVAEFLAVQAGFLTARSGRDHRVLWRVEVRSTYASAPLLTRLDANGDGVSDIVLMEGGQGEARYHETLAAYSGKDGQRLWTAPDFGLESGSTGSSGGGPQQDYHYPMLNQRDLDGDGQPEILIAGHIGLMNTNSLAALSHDDGRLLWKIPILNGAYVGQSLMEPHIWHDLDGDGVLDIALWVPQSIGEHQVGVGAQVCAFSGRDGSRLWKDVAYTGLNWPVWPRTQIADLDGDGTTEVVVTSHDGQMQQKELAVLGGKSGQRKWNWTWKPNEMRIWPPLPVHVSGNAEWL